MRSLHLTRRSLMAGTAAALAMPSVLRATTQRLERLVLQTPASGPGILMAHARAIGAFDDIADTVDLPIWTGFDQMRAGLVSGQSPVTIMPTQGAASLYNRGFELGMIATVTDGHCGLIARGVENCDVADLRGKTVVLSGITGFTGHMMRLALAHANIGLDEVTLMPAATHMEAGQILLSGRADVGLIAEPAASGVLMRAEADGVDLSRGVQMREVLGRITGLRPALHQACLAIRSDYAAEHPWLPEALHTALATAGASLANDPAQAARDGGALLDRPAPLLERAIPYASIHVQAASEARAEVEALYSALYDADPEIIGGRMPDDGLYVV